MKIYWGEARQLQRDLQELRLLTRRLMAQAQTSNVWLFGYVECFTR